MHFTGKILVVLNLLMSCVFVAFAAMVYVARVDMKKDVDVARKEVTTVRRDNADLNTKYGSLLIDNNSLRGDLDKAKQDAANQANDLNAMIARLEGEVNAAREEAALSATRVSASTTEQVQRRDEVDGLRRTRDALVTEKQSLLDKVTELQDNLAQANNEKDLLLSRNKDLLTQVDQLQGYIVQVKGTLPKADELRRGADVEPPPDVEGIVRKVDRTGRYIEISLGEDDGLRRGHRLQVWRTKPQPKYLGELEVASVEATTSVARPVSTTGPIMTDDQVGTRIFVRE